jgi:4-carboxymuconolactone decarboxylase
MSDDTQHPISCFSVPSIDSLPDDIRERLETVQQKAGFIPNVMRVLARRPSEFRAFMAYHDALMEGESGLSKAEREMIVVATSGANHCQYCVVAHGAILRIRAKNPLIADQVATNYRQADITARQQAMLDYAMKVSRQSAEVTQADRESAKAAGLTDEDLWDIASISAFFAMSNRLASATQMRPNAEFYSMGRGT